MPSPTEITVAQLSRLIGLPDAPALVDVRSEDEYRADPQLLPSAHRLTSADPAMWRKRYAGQSIVLLAKPERHQAKLPQRAFGMKVWTLRLWKEVTKLGARIGNYCFAPKEFPSATKMVAPPG